MGFTEKGRSNASRLQRCGLQEEAKEKKKKDNPKEAKLLKFMWAVLVRHYLLLFSALLIVKFGTGTAFMSLASLFGSKAEYKTVIVLITNDNLI